MRWSYELHHRFIDAVNQLGGPNSSVSVPFVLLEPYQVWVVRSYFLVSFSFLFCYVVVLEATPKGSRDSWAYFVPSQESFTGFWTNFHWFEFIFYLSFLRFTYSKLADSCSISFNSSEISARDKREIHWQQARWLILLILFHILTIILTFEICFITSVILYS